MAQVIPVGQKKDPALNAPVNAAVDEIVASLKRAGIRSKVDERGDMRPGAKFFEWERKGAQAASLSVAFLSRHAPTRAR